MMRLLRPSHIGIFPDLAGPNDGIEYSARNAFDGSHIRGQPRVSTATLPCPGTDTMTPR